jgi:uncharacterized delta-60 repeat protein
MRAVLTLSFALLLSPCSTAWPHPGDVDPNFDPKPCMSLIGTNINSGYQLNAVLLQKDGKILIAGHFQQLSLARLNADGTIDSSFNIGSGVYYNAYPYQGSGPGTVTAMAQQPNGDIVIAGFFNEINGVSIPPLNTYGANIARLNSEGTLETGYRPSIYQVNFYALAADSQNRVVLCGASVSNVPFPGVTRITSNGVVDQTFTAGAGPNAVPTSIAIQQDGKIVIAGAFTEVNNYPQHGIARLTANGIFDPTFSSPFKGPVSIGAPTADAKILVSGHLGAGSENARTVFRLNADGTIDHCFKSRPSGDAMAIEPDGKVVVSGPVARLFPDGSIDSSFVTPSFLNGGFIVRQADGAFLVDAFTVGPPPTAAGLIRVLGGEAEGLGAPDLRCPCLTSSGDVALPILSNTNRTYAIEASSNLTDWAVWTNWTATNAMNFFIDPGTHSSAQRFYRLKYQR